MGLSRKKHTKLRITIAREEKGNRLVIDSMDRVVPAGNSTVSLSFTKDAKDWALQLV